MEHEIVVGNIGTVYSGPDKRTAAQKFNEYVRQSRQAYGRACGEPVTWFIDGEIVAEFDGTNAPAEAPNASL